MNQSWKERGDKAAVESGLEFMPKFDNDGLIPAVVQDAKDGRVLMVAFMNAESLGMTLELGEAVFYSRSRQEIWHKGQTSGCVQIVKEIQTDCDQDCLILMVEQVGGAACHTGLRTCFYRKVDRDGSLVQLEEDQHFDPNTVYGKSQ